MSVEDDLLEAIVAAPDDPAARLVYADYRLGKLANDTHAELIVVQERLHALAETGLWRDAFSDEALRLRDREALLVHRLDEHLDLPLGFVTWRRGFVHLVPLGERTPENLAKRMRHPVFSVVRALHPLVPGIDLSPIAEHLSLVDELSLPIAFARAEYARYPTPARLTLRESRFVPEQTLARDAAYGYAEARREIERQEEAHAAQEQDALAELIPRLPPVPHLAFVTSEPLSSRCIAALASYPGRRGLASATLHAGESLTAAALPRETDVHAQATDDREAATRAQVAIGDHYARVGRFRDAASHYDDAICLSEGLYPGLEELYGNAAATAGIARGVRDPDPERDGLTHRVPALLRWGQVERVLAVAPDHAGALARRGLRARAEFDLDEAADAFARALGDDALGKAYALMIEDPPSALAILNELPPSTEANVLFACLQGLQSKPEVALGLLRGQKVPLAELASGLCERQAGRAAAGRQCWLEVARTATQETPATAEAWVIAFFAAVLAAAEPYSIRRAFHEWQVAQKMAIPRPALVFDALIRLGNKVMPQVDLTMVEREVERLRGA